jgi:hypothetical protein
MAAYLEASPLFRKSTGLSAIDQGRFMSPLVSEDDLKRAIRKSLRCDDVSFRSEEQERRHVQSYQASRQLRW